MNKFQKQEPQKEQPMSQEEQMNLIAQEVENLQNSGLFRLKLLGSLERLTNSVKELNQTAIDFGTELFPLLSNMDKMSSEEINEKLIEAGEREAPEDDDFELPPPKKR